MTPKTFTADPKTIPDQCIAFNIGKAYRSVMHRFEQRFVADTSISTTQYGLLVHIAKLEPANGRTICTATGHDPSTLSRNLRGLIESGLVEACRSCAEDRRIIHYTLTDLGRGRLAEAIPVWAEVQQGILRRLGDKKSRQLLAILRELQGLGVDE